MAKIVMDACNAIAWRDDRQIARLVVEKYIAAQGDTPRIEVAFARMPEWSAAGRMEA